MSDTEIAISPLRWSPADLSRLSGNTINRAPVIGKVARDTPGLDVWDSWPLADGDGRPVPWRGGELWFALAADVFDDPEQRHAHARIHHFHRTAAGFHHLGQTFREGFTPGSREWSGSATLDAGQVVLRFTAAGERGEHVPSFRQRLFASRARMADEGQVFSDWSEPEEIVAPADLLYMSRHEGAGRSGQIKAFRDPAPYRAPDGRRYLLFTASSAASEEAYNGVIGLARQDDDGTYRKLPPAIDAAGVNNELERPHVVVHDGRCYLFWSTQAQVFAPGVEAPTGLYGAVASDIRGPWHLLNGHGLVFANPEREPFQAYSWWVLPDLTVASFVDYWGLDDPNALAKPHGRARFGGTFAPFLKLRLSGRNASVE
ncbi:MAG: glycoside hydrolase family 68 protein [Novosphingobium sp.]|uniref:glycoside hydrolase family 68 protein n=1 Tax=Novosphingobium sp. TaxID=1874826 RepID=UPI0012C34AEC|nr:glycoside hydrolase family 68 protein [Novosphingobium sp.]MPS70979.1 glycoside hydrolase family 68 protein [Novosphingobium sp.]